jgi:predicted phosphodiesterase
VDYAITSKVDFVLAAGDIYDGEWKDWRTGQFLVREVRRLSQANIPFIAIRGNHDAQSIISHRLTLELPAREMSAETVETVILPELNVRIYGQSFKTRAVTDNLSKNYPPPDREWFNIGMLHTNVDSRPGYENYAPSSLSDLRNHEYDYWALGHIHGRSILSEDPWIIYPGNLQGRHVRETGPKGAMLVTVCEGKIAGRPEFIPFDTVRWDQIEVVVNAAEDEEAVIAIVRARLAQALAEAEGRLLAARILVSGATPAYAAINRDIGAFRDRVRAEAMTMTGAGGIWIESVAVDITAPTASGVEPGILESVINDLDFSDLGASATRYCKDMLDRASGLRGALGEDHFLINTATRTDLSADLLKRARSLLLARLAEG